MQGVRAAHAPSGAERAVIIAVDAGHGGSDPGATGPSGTHEKDVTLAIARALASRIDAEPGMRAVLTRDGDRFVALRDRMERARAAHADMFISIHADAIRDREISGSSVYVLSLIHIFETHGARRAPQYLPTRSQAMTWRVSALAESWRSSWPKR